MIIFKTRFRNNLWGIKKLSFPNKLKRLVYTFMAQKSFIVIAFIISLISFQTACAKSTAQNSFQPTQNQTDWTKENPNIPKGKIESFTIQDKQYNRERKTWVYTPPGFDVKSAEDYRLLISFDGEDYLKDIPAPTILDNLLAAGKIYPTVQVFVDNSENRLGDLANHQKFADFVAKDLLPWAEKNFHVAANADKRALLGYSAGALAASFVAFRYPNLFGNILSQSGAYWRGNEGGTDEIEWLTAQYKNSAKQNLRFYIEVGGSEVGKTIGGISLLEANRHLRDVLKEKNYEVGYAEIPSAIHNPEHWRSALADGIIYLFGKPAK